MRGIYLLLLAASGAAQAGIVTIDAANFAPGTRISTATPGVTLREITNQGVATGATTNPVYAVPNNTGLDAGPQLIGHKNPNGLILPYDFRNVWEGEECYFAGVCYNNDPWHLINMLQISFQVPTDYLEMSVHYTGDDYDGSLLSLYNSQGQLLATCDVPGADIPFPQPSSCRKLVRAYDCNRYGTWCRFEYLVHIYRSTPDIAYAFWGGHAHESTRAAVNRIAFRRYQECKSDK